MLKKIKKKFFLFLFLFSLTSFFFVKDNIYFRKKNFFIVFSQEKEEGKIYQRFLSDEKKEEERLNILNALTYLFLGALVAAFPIMFFTIIKTQGFISLINYQYKLFDPSTIKIYQGEKHILQRIKRHFFEKQKNSPDPLENYHAEHNDNELFLHSIIVKMNEKSNEIKKIHLQTEKTLSEMKLKDLSGTSCIIEKSERESDFSYEERIKMRKVKCNLIKNELENFFMLYDINGVEKLSRYFILFLIFFFLFFIATLPFFIHLFLSIIIVGKQKTFHFFRWHHFLTFPLVTFFQGNDLEKFLTLIGIGIISFFYYLTIVKLKIFNIHSVEYLLPLMDYCPLNFYDEDE